MRIQAAFGISPKSTLSDSALGALLSQKIGPIPSEELQARIFEIGDNTVLLESWGPPLVLPPKAQKREKQRVKRIEAMHRGHKRWLEKKKAGLAPVAKKSSKRQSFLAKKEASIVFYESREWREARYEAIKKHGRRCLVCGRTPHDHGIAIHVDHIKPRSLFPELELCIDNLQVLCEDCNLGKSNRDSIDWR